MMKKNNQQAINALFTFLANLENLVFWICSVDYEHQYFLSPSYELIWGRSGDIIRESGLATWRDTLVLDDFQRNYDEFYRRADTPGASAMVYRVHRPDNEIRYLKDIAYTLCSTSQQPTIMAGIAEVIVPERWFEYYHQKEIELSKNSLLQDCLQILCDEYDLSILKPEPTKPISKKFVTQIVIDDKTINLSKRQVECLYYLQQGFGAKKTANELNLSVRTIENYLSHIKNKIGCRTKTALLARLNHYKLDL